MRSLSVFVAGLLLLTAVSSGDAQERSWADVHLVGLATTADRSPKLLARSARLDHVRRRQGTLRGRVSDRQTGQPLAGVQVHVPGTSLGTITNASGQFLLPQVPEGQVTVRAQIIGYEPLEQTVQVASGETAVVNFELIETRVALEELVVSVEAGDMRRRELGTDIGTVDVEQAVTQGAVSNVSQLLQGRATGVTITQGSGLVGHGSRIRVRGPSSLTQDNNPLIIIDGIRVTNNTSLGTSATSGGGTSRFNDLNPNAIASIQIVKGPAATALYGSEAASGVIVVTTKRGVTGEPAFTFRAGYGTIDNNWDYPDNYADVTEVYEITDLNDPRIVQFNAEENPVTGHIFITHNPFEDPGTSPFVRGSMESYGGSVTGGTEAVNYYASADYVRQQGVVTANDYDRLNLRGNLDFEAREDLTIGARFGLVQSGRSYPADNSTGSGMGVNGFLGSPIAAYGEDPAEGPGRGICARDALLGVPNGTTGWCEGREGNFGQTFETILSVDRGADVFRVTASATAEWIPRDWFVNRFTIGTDRTERDRWDRIPFDPELPFGRSSLGSYNERRYTTGLLTAEYTGTVTGDLGERVRRWTTFGAQYFSVRNEWITCEGEEYPNDQVRGCGQGFFTDGSNGLQEQKEVGAFVQQRFGYNDYLFLTGALRVDHNASLGAEVGAIWSPSVNASLVVSDLPFWTVEFVDDLRVRAAWGTASQSPQPYAANQTYSSAPVTVAGQIIGGITPENPGNPELGPERSEELELGLDAAFFDNRLGLAFTYYDIDTRNLIVPKPVAPSTGFPNATLVNLGLMENTGYEIGLNATLVQQPSFFWDARFTHSHYDPVITDLGLDAPIFFPNGADGGSRAAGSQVLATGFAPGAYVSNAVASATRDENGQITDFELAPGNLGDGSNLRVIGSPWPSAVQSLFTSMTFFEDLTLSVKFDRVAGYDLLNVTRAFRTPFVDRPGFGAYSREYAFRQVDSSPEHQAMIEQQFYGAFLEPGDFVKLRELNLRYALPPSLAGRLNASAASITLAGRNLHTWTDFSILDPEMDVQGSRDNFIRNNFAGTFPPLRTLWLEFNVTF